MSEGPVLTDEGGELKTPYLSCVSCIWARVHDYHYFYCRDLGDRSQPDYTSMYTGGMKRLHNWPHPDPSCRFTEKTVEN